MAAWCFVGVKIFGDLRFEAVFTLICGPMPVFQRNLRVARGPGGAQGEQVRWAPRHDQRIVQAGHVLVNFFSNGDQGVGYTGSGA
jgi:hypothetical protein